MPGEEFKETSDYGKMPVWQWIIIYLLVGGILYGLFYSFLMYKKNTKMEGLYSDEPTTQMEESEIDEDLDNEAETEDALTEGAVEIALTDEGFSPNVITIIKGQTIMWTNNASVTGTVNSAMHPTHDDYLPLNLGEFAPGESLTLKFGEVGTYKYHNHLNSTQFGSVNVVEAEETDAMGEEVMVEEDVEY